MANNNYCVIIMWVSVILNLAEMPNKKLGSKQHLRLWQLQLLASNVSVSVSVAKSRVSVGSCCELRSASCERRRQSRSRSRSRSRDYYIKLLNRAAAAQFDPLQLSLTTAKRATEQSRNFCNFNCNCNCNLRQSDQVAHRKL
ncbi:uncharacterized protein LOC132792881 isoform X2 [Drosophila nasuta]|uniref:uncharacterized protein LOC132792881 isoform X2 n=1 Tax=Drosophila nasuta TaxID=42062 RepID=UPI00295ED04C|nr:uncharacterized protein LOC132792881 isoform X2 [Drosophila nasuta]